ncbi:MAG: flagellar type III secretion system protein FliR [Alphaproteobacteria bacterium]|nr:flagellar type III secretion system protein FliR [Alphaproteobacteria bacterium]MDE1987148.1 flagellar type III secretion system protein FliR [Alphaproteobacteria bacterium]MDE2162916.1 flagellar type III secretion system protein FliR [Alphaproteobacteria bacterium]MDE2266452.1 flagellar type III secretion system protein FliR [Alphaproteobacteria bacterium]MDE2499425.1 flagellar type III secretion system protein FliR [Alphaproteobacteria bacterium]
MTITLPGLSGTVLVYLLVFARTGAMVMLLPAIGDANVPGRVRLMLALAISLALAPTVASTYPQQAPASALALGLMIAEEVTVGILVGTMARIIMSSLSVAGFLIAGQTGLSYAETLDPTSNGQQGAVIGNFFSLLGVVLIFATNLHHLAIGAIAGSYHLIPPGTGLPTADMAQLTIKLVSGSFALGFQLAAPFLVFGFAVNAAFGLLARMMPQLQVFFVAMPVNILVGFLLMVMLLGTMMTIFLDFYTSQMGIFL